MLRQSWLGQKILPHMIELACEGWVAASSPRYAPGPDARVTEDRVCATDDFCSNKEFSITTNFL